LLGEGWILPPYHPISRQSRYLGEENPAATKRTLPLPGLEAASQDTHHFQLLKDMGVLTFSDLFERHGCPDLFLLTFFVGVLTFSDLFCGCPHLFLTFFADLLSKLCTTTCHLSAFTSIYWHIIKRQTPQATE
jgi:hypothetical protein